MVVEFQGMAIEILCQLESTANILLRDSHLPHTLTGKQLVGGIPTSTHLKNMKVSWDDSSQYMGKNKHVPNHQPGNVSIADIGNRHQQIPAQGEAGHFPMTSIYPADWGKKNGS